MRQEILKVVHRKKNESATITIGMPETPEEYVEATGLTAMEAANEFYRQGLVKRLRVRFWPPLPTIQAIAVDDEAGIQMFIDRVDREGTCRVRG